MVSALPSVEVERQIARVKYAYFRCIDQKDFDELATLFADDAIAEYGGGAVRLEGRDAIVEWLRMALSSEDLLSSHRGGHPEFEVESDTRVRCRWAFEDFLILKTAGFHVRGAGFYEDTYELRDGRWQIVRTGYKRTFEELSPRHPDAQLTADYYATGGRSSLVGAATDG